MHRAYALCLWAPAPQSCRARTSRAGKAAGKPASLLSFFPEREGWQPPTLQVGLPTGSISCILHQSVLVISELCPFLSLVSLCLCLPGVRRLLVGTIVKKHNSCSRPILKTTSFPRHPQPGPPEARRIFFFSVVTHISEEVTLL